MANQALRVSQDGQTIDSSTLSALISHRANEKPIENLSFTTPLPQDPTQLARFKAKIQNRLDWEEHNHDLSRSSTLVGCGQGSDIPYTKLPKIPIRRQHFLADMAVLGTQFANTMVILQQLLFQRAFRLRSFTEEHQDFQIIHLHIDSNISACQIYAFSTQNPVLDSTNVPVIFQVAEGIWELIVRKSHLENLHRTPLFELSNKGRFEQMDVLPKGIAARAAQVNSQTPLVDRSVARLYISLLNKYPFQHVMKDIAESCAIKHQGGAIIEGWMYLFGRSSPLSSCGLV
ncbi:MAG: hypothetical protein Q9225_002078 [Loekoesia sp. 1 TL-2023]